MPPHDHVEYAPEVVGRLHGVDDGRRQETARRRPEMLTLG
jgi:hypothetical protein